MNLNQSITFYWDFDGLEKAYISLIKNWKRVSLHIMHNDIIWGEYKTSWNWKIVVDKSTISVYLTWWKWFEFTNVDIISETSLKSWNWNGKKTIVKSESVIRDELFSDIDKLKSMFWEWFTAIWKEFVLEWYWRIDILWKIGEEYCILELKKWKSTFNAIDQALRYVSRFEELWHKSTWVVIVKDIQEDHKVYADDLWINLIKLT